MTERAYRYRFYPTLEQEILLLAALVMQGGVNWFDNSNTNASGLVAPWLKLTVFSHLVNDVETAVL